STVHSTSLHLQAPLCQTVYILVLPFACHSLFSEEAAMYRIRYLGGLVILIGFLLRFLPLEAVAINVASQTRQRCFPETGFCITGRIREFWEQNGGLSVFGFPIGPQQEDIVERQSFQVQWFERNRLELHPENTRPYDVLLGRLAADSLEQQG